jgi:hypothetical protein
MFVDAEEEEGDEQMEEYLEMEEDCGDVQSREEHNWPNNNAEIAAVFETQKAHQV